MDHLAKIRALGYSRVAGKNGGPVWRHDGMDALRRTECMCRNCENCGPCQIGKVLFQVCKERDVALAVTRCPDFTYGTPQVKF